MFEVFVGSVGPKLLMVGNCLDHGDGEGFLYSFLLVLFAIFCFAVQSRLSNV
jgi:hypothetical protein